jgi:hypothetical protein
VAKTQQGFIMTEQQREWLRSIRSQTVFQQSPIPSLSEGMGQGFTIEHLSTLGWHRTGVAILVADSSAQFFRVETVAVPLSYRNMSQDIPHPPFHFVGKREGLSWQGTVTCSMDFARSQLDYLARYGLWELNDFCPAAEMIDGDYLIVRACDTEQHLAVDACLYCFDESINPYNRKLAARMRYLLELSQTALAAKRWGRLWR